MNQIPLGTQQYTTQTPLNYYNNGSVVATNPGQQGTVSVSTPGAPPQVYQYPTTSIYDPASKQATSGVNIYIYNPSAIGGPSSNSVANATYGYPTPQPVSSAPVAQIPETKEVASLPNVSIANTAIAPDEKTDEKDKKTKKVVELTNEYIKTLESYLTSADSNVRKTGIVELIKRYEEDSSRYDDPALSALLNIALQDPKPTNRTLAMGPILSEVAHGDENTIALLQNMQKSEKVYGEEAKMATEALLKASQTKVEIPAS